MSRVLYEGVLMSRLVCLACFLVAWSPADVAAAEPIRVTVIVVHAHTDSRKIDPRLKQFAGMVRKKHPEWTGFSLERVARTTVPVGLSHAVEFAEDKFVNVGVMAKKGGQICLSLKIPGMKKVVYDCSCGKYLPLLTRLKTKGGARIIVAVMAKPCPGK